MLNEVFNQNTETKQVPDFEADKLSKKQAATFAGISIPTLSKHVAEGKFKEHSLGRRKYFLKSEMTEALRNNNHQNLTK